MRDFPINKHELNLYMSEASEAERQSTVSAYASRITAGVPLTKEAVRQNIKRQIKSQPKKMIQTKKMYR